MPITQRKNSTRKTCDVCGQASDVSLRSSGIAPVTYAICRECEARSAENIGVILFWLASYGGPERAPEFQRQLVGCLNGAYVGWPEVCEFYVHNKAEVLAAFAEEFVLTDDE